MSHSPMYRGSGYLPICSECIDSMFEYYCKELGSDREAMRRICMKIDLYWHDNIYDMVERTVGLNSRVRNYISKTNIIRYIDKTYDDTIAEEEASGLALARITAKEEAAAAAPHADPEEPEEEIIIPEDVLLFWGPGYTPQMYLELEARRKFWNSKYPDGYEFDVGEEALIRQICNLEIDINRDRTAGKSIDKNVNMLNTLLGSLNVKPTQKKADDGDAEFETTPLGVWIRRWETTRPIPEPDPELNDVDGIVRYIEVWFKGHLAKMLGIKNAYSKLYEDEIARMRIERPEFEEDDDETLFSDIFASKDEE